MNTGRLLNRSCGNRSKYSCMDLSESPSLDTSKKDDPSCLVDKPPFSFCYGLLMLRSRRCERDQMEPVEQWLDARSLGDGGMSLAKSLISLSTHNDPISASLRLPVPLLGALGKGFLNRREMSSSADIRCRTVPLLEWEDHLDR